MNMATLEELIFAVTRVDPTAYDDWRDTGNGQEYTVHYGAGQANGWHATMHEAWEVYASELRDTVVEEDRISDAAIVTLSAVLPLPEP